MNRQYQKYLNNSGQKPPEVSSKKYFLMPIDTNSDLIDKEINSEEKENESPSSSK